MNVVGMIVEYNPFHNGHLWHVNEAKRISGAQYAIGIMSGNFLQRGEPAIVNKWARAALAVEAGVDLIIELPTVFSVRSAQYFATGGIQLLSRLGIVKHVCFGAETPDLPALTLAAQAMNEKFVIEAMRQKMKTGQTYAASLSSALSIKSGVAETLIQTPNNLLAIEYLRAIHTYSPQLKPHVIQRAQANYHDNLITSNIASATAIRTALLENKTLIPGSAAWKCLPQFCASQLNNLVSLGKAPIVLASFDDILLSRLRNMSLDELAALPEVTEGLHNKISAAAFKATTAQELLTFIKSKRYTLTRLQRVIIYALLGITKSKLAQFDELGPLYARILAFNHNGRKLVKEISRDGSIPVITKTAQYLTTHQQQHSKLTFLQDMLSYDITATDIYVLGSPNTQWKMGGQDFQISPIYIPGSTNSF
jgi:predicted nucleotidyltransferase